MGTTIVPFIESRTDLGQRSTTPSSLNSKDAAFQAANAAVRKKAKSTVVLDVRQVTLLADYFVFTGGESKAQVKAIAEEIAHSFAKQGRKAKAMEGMSEARWVLLDYGDVIIHILQERERDYYRLEQFWNHALVVSEEEWSEDDS
ncbi:MAG: ribosome silencing factor [Candidatus Obscuribacterales bacterium]|nr:ribosome silencing factor [Candidatus Obscuribacterales bacterium]